MNTSSVLGAESGGQDTVVAQNLQFAVSEGFDDVLATVLGR